MPHRARAGLQCKAHEVPDTPLTTSMFFIGLLLLLTLEEVSPQ